MVLIPHILETSCTSLMIFFNIGFCLSKVFVLLFLGSFFFDLVLIWVVNIVTYWTGLVNVGCFCCFENCSVHLVCSAADAGANILCFVVFIILITSAYTISGRSFSGWVWKYKSQNKTWKRVRKCQVASLSLTKEEEK